LTQPELIDKDSLRECERCSAPGFYAFNLNDFKINYCHKLFKGCATSLDYVDQDFLPTEDRVKK
jgi:hypothetical protein